MANRPAQSDPFDLVVFGGTGDLAHRKLLPALYHREPVGHLGEDSRIIAVSRRELTDTEYRDWARTAICEHVAKVDPEALERFLARIQYVSVDVARTPAGKRWSRRSQAAKTLSVPFTSPFLRTSSAQSAPPLASMIW